MQTDTDKIREQLLATQAELKKRVNRIHDHARNPLNADSSEQAAELTNLPVVSALEAEGMEELADIENAIHRLEAGTFGICITCGEEVGAKRLEARPASAECMDCAELRR